MYIADTLSRASLTAEKGKGLPEEHIFKVISEIDPAEWINVTDSRLKQIRDTTNLDENLQTLKTAILTGWPELRNESPVSIRHYWNSLDELTVQDGIIYKSKQVVIPKAIRKEMLARIHRSHLGMESYLRKARDSLYWPNMSDEVKDYIAQCSTCNELQSNQQKEPLVTHAIPSHPWSKLGVDIFTLHKQNYLVTVDYFSDFWELHILDQDTTSSTVINCLQNHFARHGTPDIVITDNGPQFTSNEFHQFLYRLGV
jgi:hypothetical protein